MKNIKQIPKPKHISQSVCVQVRGRVPVSVCVAQPIIILHLTENTSIEDFYLNI